MKGVAAPKTLTSATLTDPTITGVATFANGTAAAPSLVWAAGGTTGFYSVSSNNLGLSITGVERFRFTSGGGLENTSGYASAATIGSPDVSMMRVGANQWLFGAGTAATTTSRTEINKAITAMSDNVAKAGITVTIPNAAHSAAFRVMANGSLGAGGAIGANEASEVIEYLLVVARTAGVNAVATLSAAVAGPTEAKVAGADSLAATVEISAISGAVGATNTFTINGKVARAGGSSDNHTMQLFVTEINANATGITMA